jgi:hypothetical protein
MTMHLVTGMSSLNTRKRTAVATKTQLKLWGPEWRADNKWRKQRNMPTQTFDEYVEYRLGRAEKLRRDFQPLTKMPGVDLQSHREKYPSQEMSGGVAARKESPVYSGEQELLGIAVLHKSCLQPVFNKQDAIDIARMRRN